MARTLRVLTLLAVAALARPVSGASPDAPSGPIPYDDCGLRPWDPIANAPLAPAPGGAPCSSNGFFRVDCGNEPAGCLALEVQHLPPVLETRRSEVVNGSCVVVDDAHFVSCDEVIELRALPPACPSRPRSARSSVEVSPTGQQTFYGESIVLSIVSIDNCGTVSECRFDPFQASDPADPTRPLLCAPKARKCRGGACSLPPALTMGAAGGV